MLAQGPPRAIGDRLHDRFPRKAALALHHGITLVTRNVADFAHAGVALLNPWE